MPAQFGAFKQLLADDTDDYSAAHIAAGLAVPSSKGRKSRQPAAAADGEGGSARAGAGAPSGGYHAVVNEQLALLCVTWTGFVNIVCVCVGKGAGKKRGRPKKRKRDSDDTADE